MHLLFIFLRTGSRILSIFALVPGGPLMGTKMCSFDPSTGDVSTKLPTYSTLSSKPMLSMFPMLYSEIVYGGGLSGIIIFEHRLTYRSTSRSPGLRKAEKP